MWEYFRRDIDPTISLTTEHMEQSEIKDTSFINKLNDNFDFSQPNEEWINKEFKFDYTKLLEIDFENQKWLILNGLYYFNNNNNGSEYIKPRKHLEFMVQSYLVQQNKLPVFNNWLKNKNFFDRWMPEFMELDNVFAGEYPWHESCLQQIFSCQDSLDTQGWYKKDHILVNDETLPCDLLVTSNLLNLGSSEYDCSMANSISTKVPAKYLIDKMDLKWNNNIGKYVSQDNKIRCFDPFPKLHFELHKPSILLNHLVL